MKFDLKSLQSAREDLNGITKDKMHNTKLLRDLSYNDIDKWFMVCNTSQGDKQYSIVDDIKIISSLQKGKQCKMIYCANVYLYSDIFKNLQKIDEECYNKDIWAFAYKEDKSNV